MARVDYRLVGDAGAFLVAAELAMRGWPAALTSAGTTRTDVLAQVGHHKLPAAFQVKAKRPGRKDFQPGGLDEAAPPNANEWVILVALRDAPAHDFYVVPRDVVVATVQAFQLAIPNQRVFLGEQEYDGYRNAWDLLEEPSWRAPWRMQGWVFDQRDGMEWPGGHSGVPDDTEIVEAAS